MNTDTAVMVCGHGSRDDDAIREFQAMSRSSGSHRMKPSDMRSMPSRKRASSDCIWRSSSHARAATRTLMARPAATIIRSLPAEAARMAETGRVTTTIVG